MVYPTKRMSFNYWKYLFIFLGILIISACYVVFNNNLINPVILTKVTSMSYQTNIVKDTQENEYFRRVLFTGENSQLVVMSIPPGGEIGEEVHKYTEQTLFFLSGTGEAILNDKKTPIVVGDVVVVVPGTKHNFINTGTKDLKVYTVYTPPNHIDGRVHKTKADADADVADEAIGEAPPIK